MFEIIDYESYIDCLICSFHLYYICSMTYQKTEGKTRLAEPVFHESTFCPMT